MTEPALPETAEEWLALLAAYRTTEGCGCCRPLEPSVRAMRDAVALLAHRGLLGPASAAPVQFSRGASPAARAEADARRAEAERARVRWAVALAGRVASCDPCRFNDLGEPCETPDLCPPRAARDLSDVATETAREAST